MFDDGRHIIHMETQFNPMPCPSSSWTCQLLYLQHLELLLQVVNETLPALVKLREQGLVRFIGITGCVSLVCLHSLCMQPCSPSTCQHTDCDMQTAPQDLSLHSGQVSLILLHASTVYKNLEHCHSSQC